MKSLKKEQAKPMGNHPLRGPRTHERGRTHYNPSPPPGDHVRLAG